MSVIGWGIPGLAIGTAAKIASRGRGSPSSAVTGVTGPLLACHLVTSRTSHRMAQL